MLLSWYYLTLIPFIAISWYFLFWHCLFIFQCWMVIYPTPWPREQISLPVAPKTLWPQVILLYFINIVAYRVFRLQQILTPFTPRVHPYWCTPPYSPVYPVTPTGWQLHVANDPWVHPPVKAIVILQKSFITFQDSFRNFFLVPTYVLTCLRLLSFLDFIHWKLF